MRSTTAALAELGLELELSGWAPWRLLERGTEWILEPKSELLELLSGVRGLPLKEAMIWPRKRGQAVAQFWLLFR
jgi:hypothetical protein